MADFLAAAIIHPFVAGLVVGGVGIGGSLGIIGWCLGYDHAMRKVGNWMRPRPKADEAHGDGSTLPPARERRAFPTTPGRAV